MTAYDWSRVRFIGFPSASEAEAFVVRVEQIADEERERDVSPLRLVDPDGAA